MLPFTPHEEIEFEAIFEIAWRLRGTVASRAAIETLVEWNEARLARRALTFVAHRADEDARLIRLLRATDPDRPRRGVHAAA